MRTVARRKTQPYCTCSKSRNEGWTKDPGSTYWVHPDCGKVSKAVWTLHNGFPVSLFP